ncbi:MAG TPA: ribosome-recycling factor [Candidatus Paceibacterota bacterium]|mgnify:CR=1 FL=1|nr:ribosome-recycling factor [Candidatus Paceibacterota bacterium]
MDIKKDLETKLAEINKFFKDETAPIRGSRPTPALVEDIQVEYYGQKLPIKQLGSIMVVLPREIQINVWDANAVNPIVKEVSERLNVNAANDGNTIHINLPSLTQERKNEISKLIRTKAEEVRIKSRTARDEIKKHLGEIEKSGEITEDDKFQLEEDIQKLMDKFNEEVENVVNKKYSEINE